MTIQKQSIFSMINKMEDIDNDIKALEADLIEKEMAHLEAYAKLALYKEMRQSLTDKVVGLLETAVK